MRNVCKLPLVLGAALGVIALGRHRKIPAVAVLHRGQFARNAQLGRLGVAVGATYASTAARKVFASADRRVELDQARELRTAEAVADRLGQMKGAMMKIGQMASYLDEGCPSRCAWRWPSSRRTLRRCPPSSPPG